MKREEIMKKMSLKFLIVPTALLILAIAPGISRATITIVQANNPQPDEANVLQVAGATGTTITGQTNTNPAVTVNFTTLAAQTLIAEANGQAVIGATTNGTTGNVVLQDFSVSLANLTRFQDLIFNAEVQNNPDATATSITVTAHGFALDGTTPETISQTFDLKNGSNFHTTVASGGETLSSVDIIFPGTTGVTDAKQFRISGIQGVTVIPEPSTLAIAGLGSLGFIGFGLRRRLKK